MAVAVVFGLGLAVLSRPDRRLVEVPVEGTSPNGAQRAVPR
jgi:hypothetical protein